MSTSFSWRLIVLFSSCSWLVACGERQPVALENIDPTADESGFMRQLVQSDGAQEMTLLRSVLLQGVPSRVAKAAMAKFDQFKDQVRRDEYIAMIDFTQHSSSRRFYLVHRQSGKVETMSVAHGKKSDPDNDGWATQFSNVPDSNMSSLGAYIIAEKYISERFSDSLRLDGLEPTNNNARDRAIVLHRSTSVRDGRSKQGRSFGCPAIPVSWIARVIERTQEGSFMYAYGIDRRKTTDEVEQLKAWDLIPRHLWPNEAESAPEE